MKTSKGTVCRGCGKTLERLAAIRKLVTQRHLHRKRDQMPPAEQPRPGTG